MADFDAALASLLKAEGGYSPNDNNNGAVNFGLTGDFLKQIGRPSTPEDVKALTFDDASAIYRQYFWDAYRIGQFQDQRIATLFFHMVVNNPAKVAVMSFQLALQDVGIAVPATGFVGPKTTAAVNSITDDKKQLFIDRFKGRMLDRYKRLAASNPMYAADLPGWEARLNSL